MKRKLVCLLYFIFEIKYTVYTQKNVRNTPKNAKFEQHSAHT